MHTHKSFCRTADLKLEGRIVGGQEADMWRITTVVYEASLPIEECMRLLFSIDQCAVNMSWREKPGRLDKKHLVSNVWWIIGRPDYDSSYPLTNTTTKIKRTKIVFTICTGDLQLLGTFQSSTVFKLSNNKY